MTLVERLRDLQDHYSTSGKLGPENYHIFRDSADEIERLEHEVAQMTTARGVMEAEIERVRAALIAMVDRWEPDGEGQDRIMWENAREALGFARNHD